MSELGAVTLLAWRERGLEIQRYVVIFPLAGQPGTRCLMTDIDLLGFWGLAAVAGTSGTGLWLVTATVPSAMKVLAMVPDVKLFLLDAFKPFSPEEVATPSRNNSP